MSGEGLSREMAEALLLAMDGDFLPGAGMGLTNAGWDIPFDQARPKEIAHWAAGVLAPFVARRESEAAEKALRDAAGAWTQGQWSDVMLPKPSPLAVPVIAYSNRIGDWLRARADSVAQGREEVGP